MIVDGFARNVTTFATPINNFADTRLKFIRIDTRAITLSVTKVSDPAQHYFDKWT
jgi:hypothetical protein